MEQNPRPASGNVDAIDNLDTAKMTLRWALERIHTLETRNQETRKQAEDARATLAAQSQMGQEREAFLTGREAYYDRIEKLLSDYCKGTLDLKKLLAREQELAHRTRALETHQNQIEKDFDARKHELERRFKRLQVEGEVRGRQQAEGVERTLQERQAQMDKSYVSRELALRSTEAQLESRERTLADREARTEQQLRARQEELRKEAERTETEFQRRLAELHEGSRLKMRTWEEERARAEERERRSWSIEKAHLLAQVRKWEELNRESVDRLAELESGKMADGRDYLQKIRELEQRSEDLQEETRKRQRHLDAQRQIVFENMNLRQIEVSGLEDALVKRFEEFEAHERKREQSWKDREASLRTRDRQAHEKVYESDAYAAERAQRIDELKRELIETVRAYREKLAALGRSKGDGREPGEGG
ncbi:MAG: hypothetical protein ABII00_10585 [Elusimicrobiota bacterium]